jgi:multicomponent Na+:H+ antiporter subunit E
MSTTREEFRPDLPPRVRAGRVASLSFWLFVIWVLLTWSPFTVEQELFGAAFAVAIALVVAPFGGVVGPWRLLDPRHLLGIGRLVLETLVRIVRANVELAYRIWAPSRPIETGMVIVRTVERSPGGLTAVGLISSLIVDNQIVDLDRRRHRLQYHAVRVPEGGPAARRAAINGPVERMLEPLSGRSR